MGMEKNPKGSPWLRELYELFARVRESLAQHSEAEINDAIDEAIAAVRRDRSRSRVRDGNLIE
jgi:hypothetical protein